MQYTITINQLAVIKSGLELDIVDMAIFDFIKQYAHSERCIKLQTEFGTYFWISHKIVMQEMPILGISTGAGIIKRINRLISAGLLVRHPDCESMRKTFYKFGPNYDIVNFVSPNESLQPTTSVGGTHNESCRITPNKSLGYQYTSNQDTTNQVGVNAREDNGQMSLFGIDAKDGERESSAKEKTRGTSDVRECLFENSRW